VTEETEVTTDDIERDGIDAAQEHMDEGTFGRLASPRALVFIFLGIAVAIVGLYVLLPKLVGVSDAFNRIGEAKWYWIVVALGFIVVAFAAYAAVFKAVVGGGPEAGIPPGRLDLRASYEITMAGFAGSTFFSAAGAGGLVIIYWALRKAGMQARRAACRMVALLVLLYSFYALSVIVFGILLRTGVLSGSNPAGGTIVPAAVSGVLCILAVLIAHQRTAAAAGTDRADRAAPGDDPGHGCHRCAHCLGPAARSRHGVAGRPRRTLLLGRQHRRAVGLVPRVRRRGAVRRRRPGLLRGHGG
jgi:hypothetical protein